jgi:hypothetical protein
MLLHFTGPKEIVPMLQRLVLSLSLVGLAGPALAEPGRRQLDAHAPGEGRLAIAIEGKRVEMELEAPASDVIGFEHAPRTAKQRQSIEAARKRLANLADVMALSDAAGCKLTSATVELLGAVAAEPTAKEKGRDHGHSHGDKNAASKAPDAAKGDGHDHAAHSEFKVTYGLDCTAPEKLGTIAFGYFKSFENAEKLAVTVIGPKGQSSFAVTRKKPVLDLAGLS